MRVPPLVRTVLAPVLLAARPVSLAVPLLALALLLTHAPAQGSQPRPGAWRAWLDSPGGELPFGLQIDQKNGQLAAWILNGEERIPVPQTVLESETLTLDMDHYDSRLQAEVTQDGTRLDGFWRKRRGPDSWSELPFHASWGQTHRFETSRDEVNDAAAVTGRWAVDFAEDEKPAVGIFSRHDDGTVLGTFLTATGDYRYLQGDLVDGRLRLSCFDGAHAFLFDATLQADGSLKGDFWSRESWHETWTARRDEAASIPDPLHETTWNPDIDLASLRYPDLDGRLRALNDPALGTGPRLLYVFGSWCPNCQDATRLLVDLHQRYRDQGLSVLGLAFELTGDDERDRRLVRRYVRRHGVEYPVLVAGVSDKTKASEALPLFDRIRSYPTTVFIDANGEVAGVYTGFSGPATGPAYEALLETFESLTREILGLSPGR